MYPSCRSARTKAIRRSPHGPVRPRGRRLLPRPGGAADARRAACRAVRGGVAQGRAPARGQRGRRRARGAGRRRRGGRRDLGRGRRPPGVDVRADVVRADGRRHRHRGDSPRAADAAGVRRSDAVRQPRPGSDQLRRRRAAREHDRGLVRCGHRARDGRLAVRPADPDAAAREPAGHGRPRSRTRGGSRTGALARRTRARASSA